MTQKHNINQKTIVLDTNVCLDLFVFHDSRWNFLLDSLETGKVRALTREDCRREWQIVLTYPHLPLDDESRQRSAEEFDRLIPCLPPVPPITYPRHLPICSDPDDQKFLELALDVNAAALITKDKALLKLARKAARGGLFEILLPEVWVDKTQALNAS